MSNKELYQKKMQAQLDEWNADLDKMKAKASKASADAQINLKKQIDSLEQKTKGVRSKLSELKEAGEETWKPIKESLDAAWENLKSGAREAASKHDSVWDKVKTGAH